MIIFISFLFMLFQLNSTVSDSEKKVTLSWESSYQFDEGYYISFIEHEDNYLYAIAPQLQRIYTIHIENNTIEFFTYDTGRGPNEISSGPFGISISDEGIILNDTNLQRGILFNHSGKSQQTILYEPLGIPSGTVYNVQHQNYFLNKVLNPLGGTRYTLANPYSQQTLTSFNLPKNIHDELINSRNTFRVDGYGIVTKDHLLHANIYYGDLFIWNRSNGSFLKMVEVFNPGNLSPQQAQLGEFNGLIPPQNLNTRFISITKNPIHPDRVFLIMDSKDGKLSSDKVYDYNFIEEKIIGEYLLEEPAKLIRSSDTKLFVYSENSNKIHQYEIN